jgi:hypothetical protein
MDGETANVLYKLLGRVNGIPDKSARLYTDALRESLAKYEVIYALGDPKSPLFDGYIDATPYK